MGTEDKKTTPTMATEQKSDAAPAQSPPHGEGTADSAKPLADSTAAPAEKSETATVK